MGQARASERLVLGQVLIQSSYPMLETKTTRDTIPADKEISLIIEISPCGELSSLQGQIRVFTPEDPELIIIPSDSE